MTADRDLTTIVTSLAERIDGLDLPPDERAVLDGVLARAAVAEVDEVVGFASPLVDSKSISPVAMPWVAGLGLFGSPSPSAREALGYGGHTDLRITTKRFS